MERIRRLHRVNQPPQRGEPWPREPVRDTICTYAAAGEGSKGGQVPHMVQGAKNHGVRDHELRKVSLLVYAFDVRHHVRVRRLLPADSRRVARLRGRQQIFGTMGRPCGAARPEDRRRNPFPLPFAALVRLLAIQGSFRWLYLGHRGGGPLEPGGLVHGVLFRALHLRDGVLLSQRDHSIVRGRGFAAVDARRRESRGAHRQKSEVGRTTR
mmetsp:Transcript_71366/g.202436  ORF Transcript_71366/g.202436 Transcript_71366/m.202436 type:complete len:211 (-) Transcript_71366:585-1217(-)